MSLEIKANCNQSQNQGEQEECKAEKAHGPHTPASLSLIVLTDFHDFVDHIVGEEEENVHGQNDQSFWIDL